ncbi:ATP-binding protein [Acidilutibacter cellobiosedens]|jgi:anti-sigma regulatory factor (Ser/Thr protein kinase)|nr:ATP-binding protein [Acidilutibacter cellobiosedens]
MSNNLINMEYEVARNDFATAGDASSNIKKILVQLGINPQIVRRTAIVTYEAEMNLVIHSIGGKIFVNISPKEIEIIAEDKGPGIEDIDLVMQEGYSTASNDIRELGFGAGMGLPNMKKFCDKFDIASEINKGTTVNMKIYIS